MFYSESILARKGPLANIWLAAHWDRKLTKAQVTQTDLASSLAEIVAGRLPPMALRLTGQLLLGASKIYSRKARYLWEDCSDALGRLKLTHHQGGDKRELEMPEKRANLAAITLPAADNLMLLDMAEPNFEELLKAAPSDPPPHVEVGRAARQEEPEGFGPLDDANNPFINADFERRLTEHSIEVGRRVDSLAPSDAVAMSPLRMSRDGQDQPIDPLDYNDYAEGNAMDGWPADGIPEGQQPLLFSSPHVAKRRVVRKRRALPMDTITELTSAEIQAQVRNTRDVLLSGLDEEAEQAPETPKKSKGDIRASQVADLLERPLFGSGAAFGGLDEIFAAKVRLQSPAAVRGAAFPDEEMPIEEAFEYNDYNRYAPANETMHEPVPEVPSREEEASQQVVANIGRETASTIAHWQNVFAASKDAMLALDSLMPSRTRKQAASAFFEALVLSTKGMVRVHQAEAYAPIRVEATTALFA